MLASYANAPTQMQGLMENAAKESSALGLQYGKALTPEQQAQLKQDIVWMVQTEIDGKTVLAPVVYLSQKTKSNIASGAVISGHARRSAAFTREESSVPANIPFASSNSRSRVIA